LKCIGCSSQFKALRGYECPKCGDLIEIVYDTSALGRAFRASLAKGGPLSVWRYSRILPVSSKNAVSIGEGGTGLTKARRLASQLGLKELFVKNEGQNPTGSFKDRGMTVAMTRAVEIRAVAAVCASTGNTSASMAAYAARAGLKAIVLVPKGQIAKGKLIQAIVHGARIVQVEGNFDRALERVRKLVKHKTGLYLVNSINPYRIEGQKTLAFEVWEQLGRRVPDLVCLPVGNAGNISAIWKGFRELREFSLAESEPRMLGIQASGAAPLAEAYESNEAPIAWKRPTTIASAIRIGAPASWKKALRAVDESEGAILRVSDKDILRAQRMLATLEGIFVEPASAASIAGISKAVRSGLVEPQERIVCVVTGHGLKDQRVVTSLVDL